MSRVVVIPRGTLRGQRNSWWPTVTDAGKKAAIVFCPVCGTGRSICDRIDAKGNATPPYWCTPGECSFKETIRLDGWSP
jgi:hypothetical protein